jgi:hypothetical protein
MPEAGIVTIRTKHFPCYETDLMPDFTTPNSETLRPLHVFLCHTSGDKPAVRELYQRLRADGFEPWLDEEDLLPGQDWQHEIPRAVRQSNVVIVCLSKGSISKAGYVQKEIKIALDVSDEQPENTIFIIPLKLEECNVPDRLSRWQSVNLFSPNGYERLVLALRKRAADLNMPVAPTLSSKPVPLPKPEASDAPVGSNVGLGQNKTSSKQHIETGGGAYVGGDVSVDNGSEFVGRDKIINIHQVYADPVTSDPSNFFGSRKQSPFPISLFPATSYYGNHEDVSLLFRMAYRVDGPARKAWTTEEREAIRSWLKNSPLCLWMDPHLNLQSEEFRWEFDQSQANALYLTYQSKLPPVDSPISVKAALYTQGVAYFDVIFGTPQSMDRFLNFPRLSTAFLSERTRRFQGDQRLSWSEAYQITLAGLATVAHARFREWFTGPNGSSRLCVYLLANGAALDQRISGGAHWQHKAGIAGRDTFLQDDDDSEGVLWHFGGVEELNDLNRTMWERHFYNWGYLGFEEDLKRQPPESVLREIRAAYDRK